MKELRRFWFYLILLATVIGGVTPASFASHKEEDEKKESGSSSLSVVVDSGAHTTLEKETLLLAPRTEPLPLELDLPYQVCGLALFEGTDVFSKTIKVVTRSIYSHSGTIFYDTKAGDPDDHNTWYCFESTGSADEILGEGKLPHVRMTKWTDVIANYPGGVWYRRIHFSSSFTPDAGISDKFIREFNGRAYENSFFELLNALRDGNIKSDLDNVFCSEMTAEHLMRIGLLPKSPSNNFVPADFTTAKGFFLQNATIDPEVNVKPFGVVGPVHHNNNWFKKLFCCCCGGGE